jgi:UDP-N-acetylmuramate dehydrogenase
VIATAARRALEELLGPGVAFDAPLARHSSLGVGGPAEALASPASRDELAALVALAGAHDLALHVLGGGFNTLVLDGGVAGVVVRTHRLRRLALEPPAVGEPRVVLTAEAGVSHSQVTKLCGERGLSGLEFGAGIPGTVGGWIAMNAGVPGREAGDRVLDVELAGPGAARGRRDRAALGFRYRGAAGIDAGAVVLGVRFALDPAEPAAVRSEVERHLAHRRATQPIDQPSFGSVFKNPPGERAGRLIELAGLKGTRHGGAQISSVHANFIVNTGGARAADVLELMRRAQEAVRERTGVALEPEVRVVGRPG